MAKISFQPRGKQSRGIGFKVLALAAATLLSSPAGAWAGQGDQNADHVIRVRDLYPLITTSALFQTRDFYKRHFGFTVVFEASWFVYLAGPADEGSRGTTLAFMSPDHPSRPPGPESFDGRGMIITVEVTNAGVLFEKLAKEGAPIVHPLTDEEWGQRRFMTRDPAGVLVDVVQQIEPKQGYWERYPVAQ